MNKGNGYARVKIRNGRSVARWPDERPGFPVDCSQPPSQTRQFFGVRSVSQTDLLVGVWGGYGQVFSHLFFLPARQRQRPPWLVCDTRANAIWPVQVRSVAVHPSGVMATRDSGLTTWPHGHICHLSPGRFFAGLVGRPCLFGERLSNRTPAISHPPCWEIFGSLD